MKLTSYWRFLKDPVLRAMSEYPEIYCHELAKMFGGGYTAWKRILSGGKASGFYAQKIIDLNKYGYETIRRAQELLKDSESAHLPGYKTGKDGRVLSPKYRLKLNYRLTTRYFKTPKFVDISLLEASEKI
ncbi:hypothetical protein FACS189483_06610 [Spirochaetia bacterium]|nr:hypothetical protein FACS189483_06610 [Spirochaetia bacterium]